jgi:hypothetical protein
MNEYSTPVGQAGTGVPSTKQGVVSEASNALKETALHAKEQLKQGASEAAQQLKVQGQEALHEIQSKGQSLANQQKDAITSCLRNCSAASRKAAEQLRVDNDSHLAQYAETIAQKLEDTSAYLDNRDLRNIYQDVEGFARRQPELFFGGMFLAGLAIARFLKASRRVEGTYPERGFAHTAMDEDYSTAPSSTSAYQPAPQSMP